MFKLSDATKLVINGQEALKAVLNGEEVWLSNQANLLYNEEDDE